MIAAIVLAAGRSERMGRPKPLLPCRGSTFLGTILATLARSRVGVVRVVLGHGAEGIRAAAGVASELVAINPDPDRGMLSSVRCGISSLPPGVAAFLLWPVDHPLVEAATVDRLIAAFEASRAPIVVPVRQGRRGHPALFAAPLAPEFESAPETEGARAVVRAHGAEVAEVPVEDAGVLTGIDTPEAYLQAFGRPLGDARGRMAGGGGAMSEIKVEKNPASERLDKLGVASWPIWTKEISTFPWSYDEPETCLFLEGEVVVTPDGGQPVSVGKGDLVTFPSGMSCTWKVLKPVRKHYRFG